MRALQRLLPDLRMDDLHPSGAGVRAQAIDPLGALVDDFSIQAIGGVIHVLNAPSPAATASLPIGRAHRRRGAAALRVGVKKSELTTESTEATEGCIVPLWPLCSLW